MPLTLATVAPGEPEIFAALQGEGPSAGWPCAFVRLSRCNLACVWCDTAYTWRFAGDNRPHRDGIVFDRAANQLSLPEADVAARIAALGKPRLVITGGEPLLQAPALVRLILHLQNIALLPRMQIEVETNGTVVPTPALDALIDQYNVSPKLTHSGNPRELAFVAEALAHFAGEPRAFFKFVIAEPADIAEVCALADEYAIPAARVLLMPEGRDSATLRTRAIWLSDACSLYGFRFTDRLHIHLHGDTRGT